jgi:taurine--2-oxoglutarate transaminase
MSQRTTERQNVTDRNLPHWHDPSSGNIDIVRGDDVYVETSSGTRYLDFVSQLYCVNAGHGNDAIIQAIEQQLQKVQYVSSAKQNDARSELADRLVDVAPDEHTDVFFSISGSEANESAVQLAREYTGKKKVLTRWRSYHGSTIGASGFTGDPETRGPIEKHAAATGTAKFLPPLPRAFGTDDPEELADRAIDHLRFVIHNEGPDTIAALLTEPIGGSSGAFPGPADYFPRLRELCDEYDILLITDEVITGFGRCGDWFGIQTENVTPDMMTFAKGVTSAYVPLAGVITSGTIADHFRDEGYPLGQTFSGHPVACAAGVAAIEEYGDGLIENVRNLEGAFESQLVDLEETHDAVTDVHGRGFLWGVEFADPATGEPFVDPRVSDEENPVDEVIEKTMDNHVIVGSGRPTTQVILSPPLSADADAISEGVDALDAAIRATF